MRRGYFIHGSRPWSGLNITCWGRLRRRGPAAGCHEEQGAKEYNGTCNVGHGPSRIDIRCRIYVWDGLYGLVVRYNDRCLLPRTRGNGLNRGVAQRQGATFGTWRSVVRIHSPRPVILLSRSLRTSFLQPNVSRHRMTPASCKRPMSSQVYPRVSIKTSSVCSPWAGAIFLVEIGVLL